MGRSLVTVSFDEARYEANRDAGGDAGFGGKGSGATSISSFLLVCPKDGRDTGALRK